MLKTVENWVVTTLPHQTRDAELLDQHRQSAIKGEVEGTEVLLPLDVMLDGTFWSNGEEYAFGKVSPEFKL